MNAVHMCTGKEKEGGEKCASKARSLSIAFLNASVTQKQEGRCDMLNDT